MRPFLFLLKQTNKHHRVKQASKQTSKPEENKARRGTFPKTKKRRRKKKEEQQ
jgi:hypothetical protein